MQTTNNAILAAQRAAVFLKPPHEAEADRTAALVEAAALLRQSIERCVRAGRSDLALRALDVALEAEAR